MSEVIEKEAAELVTLPPQETALDVYSAPKGLDPWIEKIREEVTGVEPDLTTDKGRKEIASRAFKVRKMKTALDALGKEQVDRLKEIPKKIDAERKRMREALDSLADEVRQPLTEWEEAQAKRERELKAWIDGLRRDRLAIAECTAEEIRISLGAVEGVVIDGEWLGEYEAEARRVKDGTLEMLRTALAAREKYEADQAELVHLKAEADARRIQDEKERIAREAAEAATKAAEAKAQADRDASAKREADAKAAQTKAEQDAKDAIERQRRAEEQAEAERLASVERARQAAEDARLAEAKRQADEAAQIEAEAKAREADRAHKAKINGAALVAFMDGGMTEECAKQAITLIVKGQIPAIKIYY